MGKFSFQAVIFDLDGVITQTALVHAKSWKAAFDEYLKIREERDNEPFVEFTHEDYLKYVDGKPRYKGVASFLESRNINIEQGSPSDDAEKETICGVGNRKNFKFVEILEKEGAKVYQSTVDFIKELKAEGVRIGVASSSKNCKLILEKTGLEELFETRVDGVVSVQLGLQGKPEGDIFVKACLNLGVSPGKSVVVEDANSGVLAGRNGGFGLVLGIARHENKQELIDNGADVVVSDMAEMKTEWIEEWFNKKPKKLFGDQEKKSYFGNSGEKNAVPLVNPTVFESAKDLLDPNKKLVFFLDYDGTLTPIVDRPEWATLKEESRKILKAVSEKYTVAIVSGRMREDVENFVQIDGLFYAGSHGFDILGPGCKMIHPKAEKALDMIAKVIEGLKKELEGIEGMIIEEKKFSTAVHYRLVSDEDFPRIEQCVKKLFENNKELKLIHGKKVYEIMPAIEWDKGQAVRWVMKPLKVNWDTHTICYIGDDTTDEDAFRPVNTRGVSILVSQEDKHSMANFQLGTPDDVMEFFKGLLR